MLLVLPAPPNFFFCRSYFLLSYFRAGRHFCHSECITTHAFIFCHRDFTNDGEQKTVVGQKLLSPLPLPMDSVQFNSLISCYLRHSSSVQKLTDAAVHDGTHVLILVLQAGSIADYETYPESKDFKMFKDIILDASDKCYPGSRDMMSIELITSSSLSLQIMEELRNLHFSSQPGVLLLGLA